jgi:uncharacterized repeat protein (TIGR03803 family)
MLFTNPVQSGSPTNHTEGDTVNNPIVAIMPKPISPVPGDPPSAPAEWPAPVPACRPVKRSAGLIVVACLCLLATHGTIAPAQTLTTLWQFCSQPDCSDGASPVYAALVQGSDGLFYGTTEYGGTNGAGSVFQITTNGVLTTLHQFSPIHAPAYTNSDGAYPNAGLVRGSDGNFYGTTELDGTKGAGTVFRINPAGALTTLWQFGANRTDGTSPFAGLVQGRDGLFYGTTEDGGTNFAGTVFQITTNGVLTTLHQFSPIHAPSSTNSDGARPYAGLVQGSDGNFYGTTAYGGTNGAGTVFRITTNGVLTTLYQFSPIPAVYAPNSDGARPYAALVQGSDGNFYGTTSEGGTNGLGTVFRINSAGALTTLWQFGASVDGATPFAGLVQGCDGNFYGTTIFGGANGNGNIFRISPSGVLTSLYQFSELVHDTNSDGAYPYAGLVQGSDGNFYGMTTAGGENGEGVVFKLVVGCRYAPTCSLGSVVQTCKTKVNKKTDTTNTTCTVGCDLVATNPGTTKTPKFSVRLWVGQGSTLNPNSGPAPLTKSVKALKAGATAMIKIKRTRLAGEQTGTFIFATDTDSNVLASIEVPSPQQMR